ncbi:MAG: TetR/AcrR family transcriptional regulator [Acidobacteria bacterium]|jgi:TetR/AcrR family transcriptional regulator|nr:MAG: TetR/AcrR family transcriptional regulator [Acidobacteriota bacterium]GIU81362.1 MAG: TetR family transcriptional regulator [Pyrinomonadaceae bacterium]
MTRTEASRMSADERRNQILQVAIKLFSRKGFSGTTTREIAQAAGISEAIIFKHFATKSDLYSAILDYKCHEAGLEQSFSLLHEAIGSKNDYEIFYELTLNAITHHEKDPEFLRLLMLSALEGHEFAEMFVRRKIEPLYEILSEYIAQRQKDGVFRNDINPKLIVRAFLGMITHHSMNKLLWDSQQRILKVSDEEAARAFSEILLSGIKKNREENSNVEN